MKQNGLKLKWEKLWLTYKFLTTCFARLISINFHYLPYLLYLYILLRGRMGFSLKLSLKTKVGFMYRIAKEWQLSPEHQRRRCRCRLDFRLVFDADSYELSR